MTDTKITKEHELTPEEKWERATIANNFIFYKVMRHNPDVCKELLEILMSYLSVFQIYLAKDLHATLLKIFASKIQK